MVARSNLALGTIAAVLVGACTPAPGVDPPAPPDPPPVADGQFQFSEVDDPNGDSLDCPAGRDHDCTEDYVALAESLLPAGFDLDRCMEETTVYLMAMNDGEIGVVEDRTPRTADELRDRVIDVLGVREWFEGIDPRPTVATHVRTEERDGYDEVFLTLSDPLVGTFRVRLLVPTGVGPHPALIALPGHPSERGQIDEFLDDQFGRFYAEQGFVVAAPAFRAYDSGLAEHIGATSLLCAGLSTVSVRTYEALLVNKLLRRMRLRGEVDRIGAIGHSGGSIAGNVLARFAPDLDLWISDLDSTYINVSECFSPRQEWCVLDESHPVLHAMQEQLNDFGRPPLPMPWLRQPYGYPDGPDEVLGQLDLHLR